MSVPICNRFYDRQANNRKITTFYGGHTYLTPICADILKRSPGWDLDWYNLHSVAKISYAGCVGSSPTISAQFTLEMYIAA